MPSWMNALRQYNKDKPAWCMPRRGTEMYDEVRELMAGGEAPKAKKTKPKAEPKPESAMSRVMNNPDLFGKVKEYSTEKFGDHIRSVVKSFLTDAISGKNDATFSQGYTSVGYGDDEQQEFYVKSTKTYPLYDVPSGGSHGDVTISASSTRKKGYDKERMTIRPDEDGQLRITMEVFHGELELKGGREEILRHMLTLAGKGRITWSMPLGVKKGKVATEEAKLEEYDFEGRVVYVNPKTNKVYEGGLDALKLGGTKGVGKYAKLK